MAYFLISGDEDCDPTKLKALIEDHHAPTPINARKQIRLEAENFRHLQGYVVDDRKDKGVSHQLCIKLGDATKGSISTKFDEPFAGARGRYDLIVRYKDEKGSHCRYALLVNGTAQGEPWESAGEGRGWTSRTIRDIQIAAGDELRIDVDGSAGWLDYLELHAIGQ
jgi:hypothetical protein